MYTAKIGIAPSCFSWDFPLPSVDARLSPRKPQPEILAQMDPWVAKRLGVE
jgi:hypothetical protein